MDYAANVWRGGIDENVAQETQPEFHNEQPKMESLVGITDRTVSSSDTMNRTDIASNNQYLGTDATTTDDDKAILTGNRSPSPISPRVASVSEDKNKKAHESLVLKVSQESHVSVPINREPIPIMKVKSVTTKSGRVVRNIGMNNSVKYDIGSVYEKHKSSFSGYKNVFRSDSVKEDEQQPQRSLRRDGQVRRTSRRERTSPDRTMSASSAVDQFVNGNRNRSEFTHQVSTDSCTSVSSNTQLVTNPYNAVNHKLNSIVSCPCLFFFCFACCLPAIRFMDNSDKFFNEGNYNKARTSARISTALYIAGTILSIAFFPTIFAVIIIFAT